MNFLFTTCTRIKVEGPHKFVRLEQTNLKMNAGSEGFVIPILHYTYLYLYTYIYREVILIYTTIYLLQLYVSNKLKYFV
jgi:hypothetical protein